MPDEHCHTSPYTLRFSHAMLRLMPIAKMRFSLMSPGVRGYFMLPFTLDADAIPRSPRRYAAAMLMLFAFL